ncbi:hypothetical protein GCM10027052_19990 [Parafrigoribacterium mesophilum]|uniref:helix-turn-helix domain-containing protein n=1 Tax=Parafrigoribacterium mesophilum TaxID=433646 RepID=UPI0031FC4BF4
MVVDTIQHFSARSEIGDRIRRLRLGLGLSQLDLATNSGIASGVVSMIENDRHEPDATTIRALAQVLDCTPDYLREPAAVEAPRVDRPKLRAYADASQRSVDRTTYDSITAIEAVQKVGLRRIDDLMPVFDGDLNDEVSIDEIAADVRTAAGLQVSEVIPNVIRAAERLGCVVLPMDGELGRHWGLSFRVNDVPVIRVTRPSHDPEHDIPGDRQRFTVAHELGHLVLHAGTGQPTSPEAAARMENEANRFAAAFLVPGDSALDDLHAAGGRVTLSTLGTLKAKWGYSIKAFVMRFRQLGVIEDAQARSLYKQISARKWNKDEPYRVGTESAMWLDRALGERFSGTNGIRQAAQATGLSERYFSRWLNWEPSGEPRPTAPVTQLRRPEVNDSAPTRSRDARISRLPRRV